MKLALLTLLVPLVFYGLIPFLGGILTSIKWSRFRGKVLSTALGGAGLFFGCREGLSKNRGLWFRSDRKTVLLDLSRPIRVYQFILGNSVVKSLRKGDLAEFLEGTDFLLVGNVVSGEGGDTFLGTKKDPVIMISTDTGEQETLRGVLAAGYPGYMYWNVFTPWSLLAGFLGSLFMVNLVLVSPDLQYLFKLVLCECLMPLLLLLPPGGILFFLAHILHGFRNKLRIEGNALWVSGILDGKTSPQVVPVQVAKLRFVSCSLNILSGILYPAGLVINTALTVFLLEKFFSL